MRSFVLFFLLLLTSVSSFSQDHIHLRNGRSISNVRLFSEHDYHITYAKGMTLHDVPKTKIEFIETDTTFIYYKPDGKKVVEYKNRSFRRPSPGTGRSETKENPTQYIDHEKGGEILVEREDGPRPQKPLPQQESIVSKPASPPLKKKQVPKVSPLGNDVLSFMTAGALGGLGSLTVGIGSAIVSTSSNSIDESVIIAGGFGIGAALGSAVGSSLIGEMNYGETLGKYTLLGGALGTAVGGSLLYVGIDQEQYALVPFALIMPALGSTIFYRIGINQHQKSWADQLSLSPTRNGARLTYTF